MHVKPTYYIWTCKGGEHSVQRKGLLNVPKHHTKIYSTEPETSQTEI